MKVALIIAAVMVSFLTGCVSVPMETKEQSDVAKKFNPPSEGKAGFYFYRSKILGGAYKKSIWIDGKCIGESAPNVFFYEEVLAGKEYKISTDSDLAPKDLIVKTEVGKHYFIHQVFDQNIFFGGGFVVKLVSDQEGKFEVQGLEMAKKGTCSK